MYKLVALWYLATYSLDIVTKSYDAVTKGNTFMEMKEYMYSCQKREDKLREQCDLKLYRIPEDQSYLGNLIDNCYSNKNYYLANKIEALSYEHFMELSYDKVNVHAVIILDNTHYTLIREGVKQHYTIFYPREPLWQIQLNDYTLTINKLTDNKLTDNTRNDNTRNDNTRNDNTLSIN